MKNTKFPNIVEFEVTGDYALFSDPLTRVGGEKCTYQVPTYEALKGVLHSVYWKPTIIWYIDAVRVMNQIQTEVKGIRSLIYAPQKPNVKNDLSFYTYLKNCRYQVRAHFEWNENRPDLKADRNENKHHEIAKKMISKGGRRDVFLGTRECQAYVEPCVFGDGKGFYDQKPDEASMELSFGLMYHGITYADEAYSDETRKMMTARFWYPVMKNGVIKFCRPEKCPHYKHLHQMDIKSFSKDLNNFSGLDEFADLNPLGEVK